MIIKFWDIAAVEGKNPTENSSVTKSLRDMMVDLGFTEEEFALLDEADANSADLVKTEVAAMNLVDGNIGEFERSLMKEGESPEETAIRIMHDKTYMENKAKIMRPINEFFEMFEARTNADVIKSEKTSRKFVFLGLVFIFASIVIFFIIEMTLLRMVLKNISLLSDKLKKLSEAGGDLTQKIDIKAKNEVGDLANSVNDFIENIRVIISGITEESQSV